MKSKWTLFAGILLLILGIILRKTTGLGTEGLILIIIGVAFKTYYIVSKARSGEYKPGYELIFLFVGLSMFMSGQYIRSHEPSFSPALLIVPGILLKVLFIILFIIKVRKARKAIEGIT
jgi:1,4-dihydroxy-2-naphthoate octaprenyltransferase